MIYCTDGCAIYTSYMDDGYCDCSDCGDETDYTCSSCANGCPSDCGDYMLCAGYTCSDGCQLPTSYVNDSWCDCSDCGDEPLYDCDSCSDGCPSYCGGYTYCPEQGSATSDYYFTCYDGCLIGTEYTDDGYCDCDDCGDESYFTCDSCSGGCPEECGDWTYCYGNSSTTFNCTDGCSIAISYHNDDFCDCSECEDEDYYTCDTCDGGCPNYCGDYG